MASSEGFSTTKRVCFALGWVLCAVFLSFAVRGQRAVYTSPLGVNEPTQLTAAFGEIRATHFHSGIDLSTQGAVGKPIHAVSNGYVARLRVSDSGYGKCLYVRHHDGKTSVYAHLLGFEQAINRWALHQQYARRSFVVDLPLTATLFPVRAGDVIGYSGETGRSSGPHLHFEVRNEAQRALDPLRFITADVPDKTAPVFTSLAIRTMDINSTVNGQFGFHRIAVARRGGRYRLTEGLFIKGCVGLSVEAHLPLGGQNYSGLSHFSLAVNGRNIYKVAVQEVDFHHQRHVHAHADHNLLAEEGKKYTRLYRYPRNPLPHYVSDAANGVYCFNPEKKYVVRLTAEALENTSTTLRFGVNETKKFAPLHIAHHDTSFVSYELLDSTLLIRTLTRSFDKELTLHVEAHAKPQMLMPAYYLDAHNVYLWDMTQGVPHRLTLDDNHWLLHFHEVPAQGGVVVTDNIHLRFDANDLYRSLYVEVRSKMDNEHELFLMRNQDVPLRGRMEVTLHPVRYYPTEKTSVYFKDAEGAWEWMGGTWTARSISYNTAQFGVYTLLTDHVPPAVRVEEAHVTRGITLYANDELSGIASWEATIRGKWLLMEYNSKQNSLRSVAPNDDFSYAGIFEIVVHDRVGNSRSVTVKVD